MQNTLLHTLWTHNHGIWLQADGHLLVTNLTGTPLTDRVRDWIRRHRPELAAALDPHPDTCWHCDTAPVDRYDALGRPWCDPCHKENPR